MPGQDMAQVVTPRITPLNLGDTQHPPGDACSDLRKSSIPRGGTVHRTFTAHPVQREPAATSHPSGGHRPGHANAARRAPHQPHQPQKRQVTDAIDVARIPTRHSPTRRLKTPRPHHVTNPFLNPSKTPTAPATRGLRASRRRPTCPPPASPQNSTNASARPTTRSSVCFWPRC